MKFADFHKMDSKYSAFALHDGINIFGDFEWVEEEKTYYVDTSIYKRDLVLPSNPKIGFKIIVHDFFDSWKIRPLKVYRNGNPIMGIEEHLICDEPKSIIALVWYGGYIGWKIEPVTRQNIGI